VQGISAGEGIVDEIEVPLTGLLPMLTGFHAPVFMDAAKP
jgi:tRNA threonylcarbamoyladenosine biosynthesis protein TsaB